jgi:hypothetical protein
MNGRIGGWGFIVGGQMDGWKEYTRMDEFGLWMRRLFSRWMNWFVDGKVNKCNRYLILYR